MASDSAQELRAIRKLLERIARQSGIQLDEDFESEQSEVHERKPAKKDREPPADAYAKVAALRKRKGLD